MVKRILIWAIGMSLIFLQTIAWADIYSWIDENGARRFSNTAPPPGIEVERQDEIPYDEAADASRKAAEAQAESDRRTQLKTEQDEKLTEQFEKTQELLKEIESQNRKALDAAEEARKAKEALEAGVKEKERVRPIYIYPHPPRRDSYPDLKPYPGFEEHHDKEKSRRYSPAPLPEAYREEKPL